MNLLNLLLTIIPTRHLSYLVGLMTRIPLPRYARPGVLGLFVRLLRVDVTDAQKPLIEYSSVSEFFAQVESWSPSFGGWSCVTS